MRGLVAKVKVQKCVKLTQKYVREKPKPKKPPKSQSSRSFAEKTQKLEPMGERVESFVTELKSEKRVKESGKFSREVA